MRIHPNIYKKALLIVSMVLLSYPMVELVTPLKFAGGVSHSELTNTFEELNAQNVFNGSFQESFSKYVNDRIGLFAFFIKTHNQLEYSLFNKVHAGRTIVGKNNFLFEKQYIDSYFGEDYVGSEKIEKLGRQMEKLQDSLEARGKIVVYVLATGKATFYPEYIPYEQKKDTTNNERMVQEFIQRDINHIHFAPYMLELKEEYGELMFPKYGVHWSYFANIFVADSLTRYIEHKTNWDLPNIEITEMKYSKRAEYFDNDIANAMNLFEDIHPDSMAYPEFEWKKPENFDKKKVLFISDSFGWDLFENLDFGTECFSEMQFWFYYQAAHDKTVKQGRVNNALPLLARHKDLHQFLEDYDAFVILVNEPNNIYRGWGFPVDALRTIKDSNHVRVERGNEYLIEQFHSKKQWRKALEKLAEERGVTFEEMIEIYLHDPNFKLESE